MSVFPSIDHHFTIKYGRFFLQNLGEVIAVHISLQVTSEKEKKWQSSKNAFDECSGEKGDTS